MMYFEKVSRIKEDIKLPRRSTKLSAGYDFIAIEDIEIKPYEEVREQVAIKTGVKVYLEDNKFLMLANRSSNPGKLGLVIPAGVGIIDKDYVDNESNEGEIIFNFYNLSNETVVIKKGDRMGQGIIMDYYTVRDDRATGERTGGHGSTGD